MQNAVARTGVAGDTTENQAPAAENAHPSIASNATEPVVPEKMVGAALQVELPPIPVVKLRAASVVAPPAKRPDVVNRRTLVIGVVAVALLGVGLFSLRSCGSKRTSRHSLSQAEPAPAATRQTSLSSVLAPQSEPAEPVPPSTPQSAAVQPVDNETAPEVDEVSIQVLVKPDGTQFFHKGKVVGRTPFILKQPREKRTYEVVKAGYGSRRLVVTGNEKNIGFALQQLTPYPDSL